MARQPHSMDNEQLYKRLQALTQKLPQDLELHRLLGKLSDPANDEASKDRYTALVAGGAVDEGLRIALERKQSGRPAPPKFDQRIKRAAEIGLVTEGQAVELNKLRLIRNVFAHALFPISFDHPDLREATKGLWAHPVSSWSGYFAPAFSPRNQYAIVCGEFFSALAKPTSAPD